MMNQEYINHPTNEQHKVQFLLPCGKEPLAVYFLGPLHIGLALTFVLYLHTLSTLQVLALYGIIQLSVHLFFLFFHVYISTFFPLRFFSYVIVSLLPFAPHIQTVRQLRITLNLLPLGFFLYMRRNSC